MLYVLRHGLTPFVLALLLIAPGSTAQQGTAVVETVLSGGAIDDALVLGPDGALYGSLFGNFGAGAGTTVTRVDLTDGSTSVYADGFVNANGLGFDNTGALFALSYGDRRVERVLPDGSMQETYASAASGNMSGLLIHPQTGVIYVSNYTNNTIGIVNEDGSITTAFQNDGTQPAFNGPVGMTVDDEGQLYVANFNDGKIIRISANGDRTEIADLAGPPDYTTGFIAYAAGSIFATSIGRNVIEEVSLADGSVSVLAGSGAPGSTDGPANRARFDAPNGIVATAGGDTLYVSDFNSRSIRLITRSTSTAGETPPVSVPSLALLSVAPNPAQGRVTVRYQLPQATHARLVVYDVVGRQVAIALDGYRNRGEHTTTYDPSALPPGLYIFRLQAGSDVAIGRFIRH